MCLAMRLLVVRVVVAGLVRSSSVTTASREPTLIASGPRHRPDAARFGVDPIRYFQLLGRLLAGS